MSSNTLKAAVAVVVLLAASPAALAAPAADHQAKLDHGGSLYGQVCMACHGQEAKGGQGGGPSLIALAPETIVTTATAGVGASMPAFREIFSQEDLKDIAAYITETLGHQPAR